jgi:hypothetical protein
MKPNCVIGTYPTKDSGSEAVLPNERNKLIIRNKLMDHK